MIPSEPEHIFKHALPRDVACGILSYKRRRPCHTAIAGWLASHAGPDFAAMVAGHLELAGRFPDAERHYELAAQAAAWLESRARELSGRSPGTGSLSGGLPNSV